MSHYEWERGTIKLPSSETANVKKVCREANNKYRDTLLDLCKQWWAKNHTSSEKKYSERVREFDPRHFGLPFDRYEYDPMADDLLMLLQSKDKSWVVSSPSVKPGPVKQADIDQWIGPKATNRTTEFRCGQATLSFNGNTVTWNVPDNNHAVDEARNHPVAAAFFNYLRRMTWTRGSGGTIIGNNEYNGDGGGEGAGGNYVTEEFGPKVPKPVAYGLRRF